MSQFLHFVLSWMSDFLNYVNVSYQKTVWKRINNSVIEMIDALKDDKSYG